MSITEDAAAEISQRLLDRIPDRLEYPGGRSRDSIRAWFGDNSLILTLREDARRTQLEALALRTFNKAGVPTPRLIAYSGNWIIQQDLGPRRLTHVYAEGNQQMIARAVDSALEATLAAQRAATEAGFNKGLLVLGAEQSWRERLACRAREVAPLVNVEAPELDVPAIVEQLRVREPRFVKWDGRPGNTVVRGEVDVYLIDWEYCGCRNSIDHIAWLLADEYTQLPDEIVLSLLEKFIPRYSPDWDAGEALDYFYTYAVLHGLVRLKRAFRHHQKDGWDQYERAVAVEAPGSTHSLTLAQCRKLASWSARTSFLEPLQEWFEAVEHYTESLP